MDDTKTLLSIILSLQPRTVVEGAKSREDVVLELKCIAQLLEQAPRAGAEQARAGHAAERSS